MEAQVTLKTSRSTPQWVDWIFRYPWFEWAGWGMVAGLLFVFLSVVYTQFAEGEPRAGWVMLLLTAVFTAPGIWIMLFYNPKPGSRFGKHDIGLIVSFAIWIILFGYLLFWEVQYLPGPYGSPHLPGITD